MEYFLFTYPNCTTCGELRDYLGKSGIEGREYSLVLKESKMEIRRFLSHIKRDDKGAIIIPTLILQEKGKITAVLNNRQEAEDWLKSRA